MHYGLYQYDRRQTAHGALLIISMWFKKQTVATPLKRVVSSYTKQNSIYNKHIPYMQTYNLTDWIVTIQSLWHKHDNFSPFTSHVASFSISPNLFPKEGTHSSTATLSLPHSHPSGHLVGRLEWTTGVTLGWVLFVHLNAAREGRREEKDRWRWVLCIRECKQRSRPYTSPI